MTLSAHKIYGPKGAGALVVDKRLELRPLLSGGGHEHGLRSGTENVPAIVGFGAACELAAGAARETWRRDWRTARPAGTGLARARRGDLRREHAPRLPNTSYFALTGIDGETLIVELDKAGFARGERRCVLQREPGALRDAAGDGRAPELGARRGAVSLGKDNTADAGGRIPGGAARDGERGCAG